MNILAYVHLRNIHRSTGAGRVARQLMEHVSRCDGVNLHILADQADHGRIAPEVGPPWTTFPYHLFSNDTSVRQAKWFLLGNPKAERYWPAVQIVHCTAESYVPTSSSRLMVTAHDAAYFDRGAHPLNYGTLKQQVKWRLLYAKLAKKVDIFHTVSQFSADRLGAVFPEIRSRLRVVHNAVTQRFFEPVNAEGDKFIERLGLRGRRYIFLPGGLHFRKNAELVLKAWPILRQKLPGFTLVVGNHNDPMYAAQAEALAPSLLTTGFVDDDGLCALYHHAEVVWFPSRYEGFGLPLLEAMACGTPTVASNGTSIPEVAGDAALLAQTDSVEEHIEAIQTAVKDSSLRENLSSRGRQRAAQFTWVKSAARLKEVYAAML